MVIIGLHRLSAEPYMLLAMTFRGDIALMRIS